MIHAVNFPVKFPERESLNPAPKHFDTYSGVTSNNGCLGVMGCSLLT